MSSFQDIKGDFLREAAKSGWLVGNLSELPEHWRRSVPERILIRWLRQFAEPIKTDPARPQRLVNHFMLGADPEFAFVQPSTSERTPAMELNFRAAQAWGADNNGRLAEIRPAPNRSALACVASCWSTLWWMARFHPETLGYGWRAGAWYAGDGMGGHVHFGRKRSSWPRELQALDTLAFWLQYINVFSQTEWNERIRRTRGHGNYGQLGDRRTQAHGWEYRTCPSWLDSPWLAYAFLTLSKLVIFDPELIPVLDVNSGDVGAASIRNRLRGLLAYYKSRDDDAALAHQIYLQRGWPGFDVSDFKARWGIFGNPAAPLPPKDWTTPNLVPASLACVEELAAALLTGRVPEWPESAPTWKPATLPKGYVQLLNYTDTYHHPGLGELLRELVVHESQFLRFTSSGSSCIDICEAAFPQPSTPWLAKAKKDFSDIEIHTYPADYHDPTKWRWYLPGEYAANPQQRRQTVDFLTSGWAPIWKLGDVRTESLGEFESSQRILQAVQVPKSKPKPKRFGGVQLYPPTTAKKSPKVSLQGLQTMANQFANDGFQYTTVALPSTIGQAPANHVTIGGRPAQITVNPETGIREARFVDEISNSITWDEMTRPPRRS